MDGIVVFVAAGAGIGALIGGVGMLIIVLAGRSGGTGVDTDRLAATVPVYERLDDTGRRRLAAQVQHFLKRKRITAAGGTVSEIMRTAVAGNACMLRLGEDADCYPDLREVVIDGASDPPRRLGIDWTGLQDAISGGAHNPVVAGCAGILSQAGAGDRRNQGAVVHPEKWWRQLEAARGKLDPTRPPLLTAHNSETEFFSAACEAFFQRSDALATSHGELHELLAEFFDFNNAGSTAPRTPTA